MTVSYAIVPVTLPESEELLREAALELMARYPEEICGPLDPAQAEKDGAVFAVAFLEQKPVGCIALVPVDTETSEIKRLYVRATARGHGIGRGLIRFVEEQARSQGRHRLILETGIRQPEALGLYRSEGYAECPCWEAHADNPLSVCFVKLLTP